MQLKPENSTTTRTMEFCTELSIEIDNEILALKGFRRQFTQLNVESNEAEIIEEIMEKKFVGKKIDMDFNECVEDEARNPPRLTRLETRSVYS